MYMREKEVKERGRFELYTWEGEFTKDDSVVFVFGCIFLEGFCFVKPDNRCCLTRLRISEHKVEKSVIFNPDI